MNHEQASELLTQYLLGDLDQPAMKEENSQFSMFNSQCSSKDPRACLASWKLNIEHWALNISQFLILQYSIGGT
jgi:hypothetical protein